MTAVSPEGVIEDTVAVATLSLDGEVATEAVAPAKPKRTRKPKTDK